MSIATPARQDSAGRKTDLEECQWLLKLLAQAGAARPIHFVRSSGRRDADMAELPATPGASAQGADREEQRKTQLENAISGRSGTTGMKTLQDIVRGSARSDMTSTWSRWPGATATPRAGATEAGPQRGGYGGRRKHEAAAFSRRVVRAAGVVS